MVGGGVKKCERNDRYHSEDNSAFFSARRRAESRESRESMPAECGYLRKTTASVGEPPIVGQLCGRSAPFGLHFSDDNRRDSRRARHTNSSSSVFRVSSPLHTLSCGSKLSTFDDDSTRLNLNDYLAARC